MEVRIGVYGIEKLVEMPERDVGSISEGVTERKCFGVEKHRLGFHGLCETRKLRLSSLCELR